MVVETSFNGAASESTLAVCRQISSAWRHSLISHVERLQMDIVIVLALEHIILGRVALTDQRRIREAHMQIVRK